MMENAPYLIWSVNKRAEVHSLEELDKIIDKLSNEAKRKMPFTVQLCFSERNGLLITLGLNVSHLEFFSESGTPIGVYSFSPWDKKDLITVLHGDEPVELERKYFVPIDEARKALRFYFKTGERPENIRWGDG